MSTPIVQSLPHTHKDHEGARIGMWLFLFTEVLLFGGLFLLYAVYRGQFPGDFHYSAANLDAFLGGVNTIILLTSSLTMVMAVAHMERRNRKLSAIFLWATIALAVLFLINKYFEWSAKIGHGLYPNSEILQTHTPGENAFYGLYYLMTGLHGLHIVVGIVLLGWLLYGVSRKPRRKIQISAIDADNLNITGKDGQTLWSHHGKEKIDQLTMEMVYDEHEEIADRQFIKLENAGLYWHLVDVIWIFLFPLFYLIT